MSWKPGTLLGLRDMAKSFGKYPGNSVFVMLRPDSVFGGVIVLTPHGTQALIPGVYLMPLQDGV